jgi:hypothetical protein
MMRLQVFRAAQSRRPFVFGERIGADRRQDGYLLTRSCTKCRTTVPGSLNFVLRILERFGPAWYAWVCVRSADPGLRPYFLWDEDISIAEFRTCMARPRGEQERDRLMAKMLREAKDSEVWQFVEPQDVDEALPRIGRRLGRRLKFWTFLIGGWKTDGFL